MTEIGPFLLLVGSALVMHLVNIAVMVARFRVLPADWLETVWRVSSDPSRPSRLTFWTGNAIGAILLAIPTAIMLFAILRPERPAGGGALLAAIELATATAWLAYLLLGARGPRRA